MKKKTFSKLKNHLKSTELDEKLSMLDEQMPTNNTAFVFQGDPSNPQGNSFETIVDGEADETDYNIGENPANYTEAEDTSGLFNVGGVHADGKYVKTLEPPGDTSYVLGPMAAMYYTWSYPWTMVGYIRESDRKMVNLGQIDGKLSDWDGSSGNASSGSGTFYSYGQLTTEQAVWFRDIKKALGNTNDPATYSYRAYYPGPPSATPDAFGRYPCIITGESKKIPNSHPDSTPLDKQAGDNFSAQNAKNKRGIGARGNEFNNSNFADNLNKALTIADIALTAISIAGILFPEPTTSAAGVAGLANVLSKLRLLNKGRKGLGLARGLKGMKVGATGLKSGGFKALKGGKGLHSGSKGLLSPGGKGVYSAPKVGKVGPNPFRPGTGGAKYTKFGSNPFSGFSKGGAGSSPGGVVGSVVPGGARGIKIIEPQKVVRPSTFKKGSKLFKKVMEGGYGNSATANKIRKMAAEAGFGSGQSSIPFNKLPKLMNSYDYDGLYLIESVVSDEQQNEMIMQMSENPKLMEKLPQIIKELEMELELSELFVILFGDGSDQEDEQQVEEQRERVSLERRKEIFKNLNEPVVLPETKQKSYKVSPGKRFKKSQETNFQGMDKLFNKNIGGPQPFKPQERTSWTKDFINQNIIKSQEKMNGVLELIGDGKHAFNHAMNDYRRMGAKELEQYWGKNPNMYSFLFNGKKYNVTRKEEVEGDLIVFMEDQQGVKSNMLQSELNEKMAEQNEKWIEEEYFKSHPVIPDKEESTYDRIKARFLENKKIAPEFPAEPPPKMVNGFHPEYGKKANRYKKLDPHSANAMPETGDPEIDAIVRKQKTIKKIKKISNK